MWQCEHSGADVIVKHGVVGGKIQTSSRTSKVTNVGRSNERSAEEQAKKDCKSLFDKQLKKGYCESMEETENNTKLLPMLASDFEKRKSRLVYPLDTQPKLDGVRCLATWVDDKVVLLSRSGKVYSLPHIEKDVALHLLPGEVFDGEIYIHGTSLQSICSIVKRYREESNGLQYWVYDSFRDRSEPWGTRKLRLLDLCEKLGKDSALNIVKTTEAFSEEDVYSAHEDYVSCGFEGAIIREKHAPYEVGYRSSHLLKLKVFKDDEFRIVGFGHGEGRFSQCVIWQCVTKEGNVFSVVPRGTIEQKEDFYLSGYKYIGSWLKVRYFTMTDGGVPQFPVGLCIRLQEDM